MRMKIDSKARKRIGKIYSDISSNLHERVPLQRIFDALWNEGIMVLQEDMMKWEGLLLGPSGSADFDIAFEETKNPETLAYKPITNSMLRLSWYFITTKYEITVYLS